MYPNRVVTWLSLHRRSIVLWTAATVSLAFICGFTYSVTCGFRGCPSIEEIRAYVPLQGGRVLDRNGEVLGYLDPVRRITVSLDRIPDNVRNAFIAVEDRRFASHHGVDWHAFGRAFFRNATSLGVREGASTLTMQVARSAFFGGDDYSDRSFGRKLIELRLTRLIEGELTKDQILELYLNLIYLGDDTYGVEAASRHYFGKSVDRLTLAEAAMLAGLPRAPSVYDPREHPDRAIERRNLVLSLMAQEGFITRDAAEKASDQRLRVARQGWTPPIYASYAVEAVRDLVAAEVGNHPPYVEIVVQTTFDRNAQMAAERAVRDRAVAIGGNVQGAMVALDPATGEVLAMVGGTGPARGGYNRAWLAHRQPGSAFKPFVYAAALESGLTPATMVDDQPVEIVDAGRVWRPANFGDDYSGTITIRDALAHSANSATVRISQEIGIARVASMARRVGITSPLAEVPSLALGSSEVTPIELVTGYAPFANGGWKVEPRFMDSIMVGTKTVYREKSKPRVPVLDSVTAFLVTSMLRSVVDEGTGYPVRQLGVWGPVAGKTGTTNNGADVWFVGYTPSILAGFWFGYDAPKSIARNASGGRLAAPAWAAFYKRGWQDRESGAEWPVPDGVVEAEIDPESGMLAGEYCPTRRNEFFRSGTEPTEECQLHEGDGGFFNDLKSGLKGAVKGFISIFRNR
jgi:1A family penicillin-binding protein